MKSYKEIAKKYQPSEIAASFVFPNDQNEAERKQSLESFREWRKDNESTRTIKSKLIAQLLQIKFLLEDSTRGVKNKNAS